MIELNKLEKNAKFDETVSLFIKYKTNVKFSEVELPCYMHKKYKILLLTSENLPVKKYSFEQLDVLPEHAIKKLFKVDYLLAEASYLPKLTRIHGKLLRKLKIKPMMLSKNYEEQIESINNKNIIKTQNNCIWIPICKFENKSNVNMENIVKEITNILLLKDSNLKILQIGLKTTMGAVCY